MSHRTETTPTDPMTGLRTSMEGDYSKGSTMTLPTTIMQLQQAVDFWKKSLDNSIANQQDAVHETERCLERFQRALRLYIAAKTAEAANV